VCLLRKGVVGMVGGPSVGWPRRLPVVVLRGRLFFRDERLREFRAVDNPHERLSFEEVVASDLGELT
jgi:hypothetical protein